MSSFDGLQLVSDPRRPQTDGLYCQYCDYRQVCGGFSCAFDCTERCKCTSPQKCHYACPRSSLLHRHAIDVGGLLEDRQYELQQQSAEIPPVYVPKIHHGYKRKNRLLWPYVAVSTYSVVAPRGSNRAMVEDGAQLRASFGLHPETKLILSSTDKDSRLARYWRDRGPRQLARRLANLGVSYVTTPNFSFPTNAHRLEHICNRKRTLICAEELCLAGLNVVLHLNAVNRADWEYWLGFLRDHPTIRLVCKEFQTGPGEVSKGPWHIAHLQRLEDALGRPLHVLASAGRKFIPDLRALSGFTIIDSQPFISTFYRKTFDLTTRLWFSTPTARRTAMDNLLLSNISNYSRAIAAEADGLPRSPKPPLLLPPASVDGLAHSAQLSLWA